MNDVLFNYYLIFLCIIIKTIPNFILMKELKYPLTIKISLKEMAKIAYVDSGLMMSCCHASGLVDLSPLMNLGSLA